MMEQLSKDRFLTLFEEDILYEEDLIRACFNPARDFLQANLGRKWETADIRKALSNQSRKSPFEEDMFDFCVWFYSQQQVMEAYFASFSPKEKRLITEATWSSSVSRERINEIFGRNVIHGKRKSSQIFSIQFDDELERWKDFFERNAVWAGSDEENFLTRAQPRLELPLALRIAFSSILPKPDGYYLKPYRLEGDEMVFSAEEAIFKELPLLITHYLQGNIRYSQKGYPVLSSCNKMNRMLQLSEFPGNDEPGLRAMLLAGALYKRVNMEMSSVPPLETLTRLFTEAEDGCRIPVLLDYLKGIRNLFHHDCNQGATLAVLEVCAGMNTTDWTSLRNIRTYLKGRFIDFEPLFLYYTGKLRYQKQGREWPLEETDIEQRVTGPALAAHFYWLAAFGLIELAIDCHDPCPYSWYDGLRACRLTALGAYLLGVQKKYTPPKSKSDVRLTFDEHNLVIAAEGNLMLAEAMLSNYAVRAGNNHYQFSPGKFLKDCHSEDDLKKKIGLFKRTVGGQLPPLWETSLKRLTENSRTVSPKRDMRIYELPAADRELHRLVAQDAQLRPFIIKAEKFHVLVAERDAGRFTDRMKELGYLIG